MDITGKRLIGLPVFAIDNGQKVGQVKDYLFDPKEKGIIALIIGSKGLMRDDYLLPFADLKHIGPEAVTIENERLLRKKGEKPEWANLLREMPDVIHLPLMAEDGVFLGKATEFVVDTASGALTALEIGGGMVENLRKGKSSLPIEDVLVIGNDVILVTKDAAARLAPLAVDGKGMTGQETKVSRLTEKLRGTKAKKGWPKIMNRQRKRDVFEPAEGVVFPAVQTSEEDERMAAAITVAMADTEDEANADVEREETSDAQRDDEGSAASPPPSVDDQEEAAETPRDYRSGPARTGIRYK